MTDGRNELRDAMVGSREWQHRNAPLQHEPPRIVNAFNMCVVAALILGLAAIVLYAPRASAAIEALQEPPSPATHQLWACAGATACKPYGRPMGKTACDLDAASLTNALPPGSRIYCTRVGR